mgnify:FL=1
MTIIFMGKEARHYNGMKDSFDGVHVPAGLRDVASSIEIRQYLLHVTQWSSSSPTARAVLKAVHDSPKEVYLVGMKGGYQCFSSDEPRPGTGVIYVDIEGNLTYNKEGPHIGPKEQPVAFPNEIALLHEFGHAKQWIERPDFFNGNLQNTNNFANDIKADNVKGYAKRRDYGKNMLKLRQVRMTKPGWSVRIETDNMINHEWPIAHEMNYPIRQYTELGVA